jgi:hypothetical protein
MTHILQPPSLESKTFRFGKRIQESWYWCYSEISRKTLRLLHSEIEPPAGLFNRVVT